MMLQICTEYKRNTLKTCLHFERDQLHQTPTLLICYVRLFFFFFLSKHIPLSNFMKKNNLGQIIIRKPKVKCLCLLDLSLLTITKEVKGSICLCDSKITRLWKDLNIFFRECWYDPRNKWLNSGNHLFVVCSQSLCVQTRKLFQSQEWMN